MIYLLDSDIFTHAYHRKYGLRERIASVRTPDEVAISAVTRVEALKGRVSFCIKADTAADLLRAFEWLEQTERYLSEFRVVPYAAPCADCFARLRADRHLGKIDKGDLIQASVALAHKATLVTRNLKDFALVPGLRVENWAD